MAGHWHDLDSGGEFSIAGWQADSTGWYDVEKGDMPFEESYHDLGDLEIIVYHYHDEMGNDTYFTLYGPFDDWETIGDLIDDAMDRYGVAGG